MSALVEKFRHSLSVRMILKYLAVIMTAVLLFYYCVNPDLYTGETNIGLLQSRKTYLAAGISFLLIVLLLTPNQLSDRMNRILSWVWFAAAPFAVYFSLLYLNADKFNIKFFELNKIALAFTFLFLFLVQGLLFALTGSIRFSVIIYAVLVAVLGIANCFVISFRGMALSAGDLFSVQTAMTVASEYTYKIDWYIYMEIVFTFTICVISLKLKGGRMAAPAVRVLALVLCASMSFGYYYICCRTDFLEEHEIRSTGFTHQLRYKQYDMLFTTLCTCFYLSVDKPEGYSVEAVEEIAAPYIEEAQEYNAALEEKYALAAAEADSDGVYAVNLLQSAQEDQSAAVGVSEQTPNLIVIMNESFADYSEIGNGLTLSEDCMPFIRSLTENTIKGNAYASIFGANTPNSEYEFLTGNTMGFLPESSVGFHLFVRGDMPSIASQLNETGYYALAMHPYRGTNYRRNIVYPQIGFDTYYNRDDFWEKDYIRNYISDQCLAERIVSEYERNLKNDTPLFSYNVSVQNHGGYYSSNVKNLDLSIKVLNTDVDQTKTEIYVNLIRETDRMFEYLVDYFSEQEEPTAILMFGDHQPSLGDSTYEALLGEEASLTTEELMEKYKVPFVIWTNYDIEEETIEKTSLNYLYSIMADRLGLSMTGYQRYLLEMSEEIPVLNALGYWTGDGTFYELGDETSPYYEKINEYNILEYNYILGGNNRCMELFAG